MIHHQVTEAMEENEGLMDKVKNLEAENRELREQLEELSELQLTPQATPQAGVPARTLFTRGTAEFEAIATRLPKHPGKFVENASSMKQENSRLSVEVRSKGDEIQDLQDQVRALQDSREVAEASSRQFKDELHSARKQVAMAEAQHLADRSALQNEKAKARSLDQRTEVRRLQDALAASQQKVQQLEDQLVIAASQAKQEAMAEAYLEGDVGGTLGLAAVAAELTPFEDEFMEEELAAEPQVRFKAPPRFAGHMQKKSPSTWRKLQPLQERFFVLESGKLSWWQCLGPRSELGHSHGERCKGSLDFGINPCTLEQQEGGVFCIRPQNGDWHAGNFTNSAQGRVLEFSTNGSEHSVEEWCRAIKEHIEHGSQRAETVAVAIAAALIDDMDADAMDSIASFHSKGGLA